MARKSKSVDYGYGMDESMAETLGGESARKEKLHRMFPDVTTGNGEPSQGTAPKEVPTDKHWAEVEAQIQQKRAINKGLQRMRRQP